MFYNLVVQTLILERRNVHIFVSINANKSASKQITRPTKVVDNVLHQKSHVTIFVWGARPGL